MFIEALEYIGIIAIILTAIVSYNQYKAGKFSKDYVEVENKTKKESRFKKWWNQSYIREIYRVRASQRKLICFIPWLGVWISLFFVFVFVIFSYESFFHPLQSFEKLKKYEGVVTNYVSHRKVADTLQIKLKDGTIKSFYSFLMKASKTIKEQYIGKEVIILVQKDWDIVYLGYFEAAVMLVSKDISQEDIYNSYNKRFNSEIHDVYIWLDYLYVSFKWLIGSLALLWFINRKPIVTINEINKKD